MDLRNYGIGAQILRDLNVGRMRLMARPRKMPSGPGLAMFDRRIEAPIGIAAGPLLNSRWVEAYARLGYGLLTWRVAIYAMTRKLID